MGISKYGGISLMFNGVRVKNQSIRTNSTSINTERSSFDPGSKKNNDARSSVDTAAKKLESIMIERKASNEDIKSHEAAKQHETQRVEMTKFGAKLASIASNSNDAVNIGEQLAQGIDTESSGIIGAINEDGIESLIGVKESFNVTDGMKLGSGAAMAGVNIAITRYNDIQDSKSLRTHVIADNQDFDFQDTEVFSTSKGTNGTKLKLNKKKDTRWNNVSRKKAQSYTADEVRDALKDSCRKTNPQEKEKAVNKLMKQFNFATPQLLATEGGTDSIERANEKLAIMKEANLVTKMEAVFENLSHIKIN